MDYEGLVRTANRFLPPGVPVRERYIRPQGEIDKRFPGPFDFVPPLPGEEPGRPFARPGAEVAQLDPSKPLPWPVPVRKPEDIGPPSFPPGPAPSHWSGGWKPPWMR